MSRRFARWSVVLLTSLFVAGGCSEATAPIVAGKVFSVTAVDGAQLPTVVSVQGRATCAPGTLDRSELAFSADGTFEQRLWWGGDSQPAIYRTSFVQRGSEILVEGAGRGTVRGRTLRLELSWTLVCATSRWDTVLGN